MAKFSFRTFLCTLLFCYFYSAAAASDIKSSAVFPGLLYPIEINLPAGGPTGAALYESPFSLRSGWNYNTLLLEGEMPDPAVRIDIEFSSAVAVPPEAYKQTGFRRFPNGRFWAKYRFSTVSRQPLRLRVIDLGLKTPSTLTLYTAELLNETGADKEPVAQSTAPYIPDPSFFVPETIAFPLVRRAAWQAAPPKEPYDAHVPFYFTLHHTQAHYPKSYEDSVIEMQFIQDFHQHGRNWNDIGYHFLIDPFGNIFEGRPVGVVGAHAKYRNTGNIGISFMGSYHVPQPHIITEASLNSFVTVGAFLKDAYTVNKSSFYAHRDLQPTDCPGDYLYARMEPLRALIFNPQPVPVPGPPAFSPVTPAQSESLRRIIEFYSH